MPECALHEAEASLHEAESRAIDAYTTFDVPDTRVNATGYRAIDAATPTNAPDTRAIVPDTRVILPASTLKQPVARANGAEFRMNGRFVCAKATEESLEYRNARAIVPDTTLDDAKAISI